MTQSARRTARPARRTSTRPSVRSRRGDDYAGSLPAFRRMNDPEAPAAERRKLRDQLVERHLPVARHIARRFSKRGTAVQDLEQVASIGLVQAVDRFNPNRSSDFLSFAVPTMMGEVRRYFRDFAWSMRVPRSLKELHLKLTAAIDELTQRDGRSPRPSELAEHLQLPVEEVIEGMQVSEAFVNKSLDQSPADTRSDESSALGVAEAGLAEVEIRETLLPALRQLPERERKILLLRFWKQMTQSQIAREVGVSQMHVSRLLGKSLRRLRTNLTSPR